MTAKMEAVKQRAFERKNNPLLRQIPNGHDLRKAAENARVMSAAQYMTIRGTEVDQK